MAQTFSTVFFCIAANCFDTVLGSENEPRATMGGRSLRSSMIAHTIVTDPDVNHTLIICNAYAYPVPLGVFKVRTQSTVLAGGPVAYRTCTTAVVLLEDGDQLDFKAGHLDVGTFYATGLPKEPTTLLVAPHRRDNVSLAVGFESHAFSSHLNSAQMAVIDAYKGSQHGVVKIMDVPQPEDGKGASLVERRVEDLQYNKIVALSPGQYQIGLTNGDTQVLGFPERSFKLIHVSGGEKIVAMRVGADDGANTYPQDLLVFAQSVAYGSARFRGVCTFAAAVLALTLAIRDLFR